MVMEEDTVIFYAVFDSYGRPLGFYPSDIFPPTEAGAINPAIPKEAVVISRSTWQTLATNQPFVTYLNDEIKIHNQVVPSARADIQQ